MSEETPHLLCSCGGEVEIKKTFEWCRVMCPRCEYVFMRYYSRTLPIAEAVSANGGDDGVPPFVQRHFCADVR